jgi:hypothetical protein
MLFQKELSSYSPSLFSLLDLHTMFLQKHQLVIFLALGMGGISERHSHLTDPHMDRFMNP